MATTGIKYPALGETVSESPWSDNTWVTPTNIYADDAATANVTASQYDLNDQTYVLKATGFDFSVIPDNATILGVTCRVNTWYRSGQGSGSLDLCQLLDTAKAKVGTNQCATPIALTTDDTTIITKGGASDLWGNALTPAWVKNSNFGVALGILATANNADVDIDYVTLEITYSAPIAYTLTAGNGTFVLTGFIISLLKASLILAAMAGFTFTGQAASLERGYKVSIDTGSYAETGQAVNFKLGRKVSIGVGDFVETGQLIVLRKASKLNIDTSAYSLTGQIAGFYYGRKLLAELSSFDLTGFDVILTYTPGGGGDGDGKGLNLSIGIILKEE